MTSRIRERCAPVSVSFFAARTSGGRIWRSTMRRRQPSISGLGPCPMREPCPCERPTPPAACRDLPTASQMVRGGGCQYETAVPWGCGQLTAGVNRVAGARPPATHVSSLSCACTTQTGGKRNQFGVLTKGSTIPYPAGERGHRAASRTEQGSTDGAGRRHRGTYQTRTIRPGTVPGAARGGAGDLGKQATPLVEGRQTARWSGTQRAAPTSRAKAAFPNAAPGPWSGGVGSRTFWQPSCLAVCCAQLSSHSSPNRMRSTSFTTQRTTR